VTPDAVEPQPAPVAQAPLGTLLPGRALGRLRRRLDFAPGASARTPVVGWLLLAAAVALAAAAAARHEQLDAQRQQRAEALDRAAARTAAGRAAPVPDTDSAQRLAEARAVSEALLVPWERVFAALESVPPPRGVALLEIAPQPRDRRLRLAGEAPGVDAVLGYVGRLADSPLFHRVHLVELVPGSEVGSPTAFAVLASWGTP
jgi:hypothetical protein